MAGLAVGGLAVARAAQDTLARALRVEGEPTWQFTHSEAQLSRPSSLEGPMLEHQGKGGKIE